MTKKNEQVAQSNIVVVQEPTQQVIIENKPVESTQFVVKNTRKNAKK